MEELLPAVLVCLLAVPILGFLGSYTRRVRAQLAVHKIGDPTIAHRALIDNADDFSDRPAGIFPVSLATWRDGEPNENVTTVSYGRHWSALRCNLAADILHPTRLASLAPLQQEAARALVACLSGAGAEVADVREHITAAVFALVAQLCFGEDAAVDDVRAMGSMIREFLFAAGELSPRFDGSTLSKLLNWRGLRGITGMIRRQGELYLPLIEARRGRRPRLPLCAGGGIPVHPYVGSLLDLRVPDQGNVLRALRDGECWSSLVSACLEWTLAHLIDQPEVQETRTNCVARSLPPRAPARAFVVCRISTPWCSRASACTRRCPSSCAAPTAREPKQ
ncbi:hypothetical protein ACQ4PT_027902 [Festuca glaucescens]